jgi:mannosyltransferase OCH1-like enzyme
MIPRIIHQIWINPIDPSRRDGMPPSIIERSQKWRALHPDFQYRLWSLADAQQLSQLLRGPRGPRALGALRFPAARADVARLMVMRAFGGFWIDLRLNPRRAFLEELRGFDLLLAEHFPQADRPDPGGDLINSFIGAAPHQPFFGRVLDRVLSNIEQRESGSIFGFTGGLNLTRILKIMQTEPGSLGTYHVLGHQSTWGKLFGVGSGDYNARLGHWRIREETESPYIDG